MLSQTQFKLDQTEELSNQSETLRNELFKMTKCVKDEVQKNLVAKGLVDKLVSELNATKKELEDAKIGAKNFYDQVQSLHANLSVSF